jgi:methionyl-tRNA formyltransferase
MRAVFFGTPEFAVPSLAAMVDAGIEVPLVVTQPDRPVGRHAALVPSPIARLAAKSGIAAEKPDRLKGNVRLLEKIASARPDVGAVVAYGRILPEELLEIPRLGFVNVHGSLLPKFRGASPVAAAILAGERETGVVTMKVAEELDSGPVFLERRVAIGPGEDAGSLSRRLAELGAPLLVETLRGLEAGTLAPKPQNGEPSFCRTIRREDGEIDWTLSAGNILRRLRAYTPWPGVFTFLGGERVKILEALPGPSGRAEEPGTFWTEGCRLLAAAGGGSSLELSRVQRAGRVALRGADFALGVKVPGRFGRTPS